MGLIDLPHLVPYITILAERGHPTIHESKPNFAEGGFSLFELELDEGGQYSLLFEEEMQCLTCSCDPLSS